MSSKTEDLLTTIRQTTIFRQLIPQETGVGWPVPTRRQSKVYVILPFFGFKGSTTQNVTDLYPPFATFTLQWSNLKLVEYVDLRFRPLWENGAADRPIGQFPHDSVKEMSVGEYRVQRHELMLMYDELFANLEANKPFTSNWNKQFSQALNLLMEPPLVPYYHAIAPKFIDNFIVKVW